LLATNTDEREFGFDGVEETEESRRKEHERKTWSESLKVERRLT
jgi:hypothetical protein